MKRILVISWFYPPINSSEALVTYKLLKASNFQYDVFTQKEDRHWSYGINDNFSENSNVNVIFSTADNLEEWKNEAIEYYKKNKDKYDIIMTRSMPPESHEVGIEIKRKNPEVKWIASFGDPIADNPFTRISDNEYYKKYSINKYRSLRWVLSPKRIIKELFVKTMYLKNRYKILKKEKRLQEQIIKKADRLVFNNEYQRKYMMQNQTKYNKKTHILEHSFDSELYPDVIKKNDDKVKITYVGHLDDIRSPKLFLEALKDLRERDSELNKKVSIEFYGNLGGNDKIYIIDEELTDIVKIKKPVTYMDSLQIMQDSDWLLIIDANISQINKENIFFAAKLADYMGTNKQIFGITMNQGATADILNDINALNVSYSVEEIKNYLWLIIYNKYYPKVDLKSREKYSSKQISQKLDEIIKKIDS